MGDDLDLSRVHCRLDELLESRGLTLVRLSEMVGVSVVNLSILKNDRAKAMRFSTLTAICDALGCDVGDLLTVRTSTEAGAATRPTPPTTAHLRGGQLD